jgi:hypothetical protein
MRSITSLTDLTSLTSLTSRDRHRRGATATPAGGTRRRHLAVLSATALAAATLLAGNGAADAAISPGGGRNPDRTPVFLRDAQGLALRLCTDTVNCEPAAEAGEIGSYFSAEAELGPMRAIWGIDAAFLEDAADNITDRPTLTSSALFRAEGLRPNRRYTIRGPWGTHRCTTDGQGQLTNKNCLFERGGEAGGRLGAGPIKSFLYTRLAPRGFLGDLVVPQRVTGSPTGFNRVTLRGPGVRARTRFFVLGGQMAEDQPMALMGRSQLRLGSRSSGATVTKTLHYRSVGTAPVTMRIRKAGNHPGAFRVTRGCGELAPRQSCRIEVTFNPGRLDRFARLVVTDNTLAGKRRVFLTGIAPR